MTPENAYRNALQANVSSPGIESIILQDAYYAYCYAKNIIKGRWADAEPFIIKEAISSYYYARDIIKGRWEEGEDIIAQNDFYAYLYAKDVLKGRWEEGEQVIATDVDCTHLYAKDVLHFDIKCKDFYILAIKFLWNGLPEELKNDPEIMVAYFKEVILR
jgi:hypothetical protein